MQVTYGEPRLFRAEFPADTLRAALSVLPGITAERLAGLVSIAEVVAREAHGSMLVINPRASDEATRLGGQATAIKPCQLSKSVLEQATRIDGALLVRDAGYSPSDER